MIYIGITLSLIVEIVGDFQRKMEEQETESRLKAANCEREYFLNQCDPSTRIPIAQSYCQEREACMQQTKVYVLKTMVIVLGETLESLVAAMSWRTLLFIVLGAVLIVKMCFRATAK